MSQRHVQYNGEDVLLSTHERLGPDRLLVCLHGLGCAKEGFDDLFATPELKGFSIIAVDLPGHGGSVSESGRTFTMNEQAELVKLLIDQIGPRKVSIVAHSMGGAVGMLLARQGLDIDQFVSIEGNLVAEDCGYASRLIAGQTLEQFVEHGYQEFLDTLEASDSPDLVVWSQWLRQASPAAIHANAQSLVEWSDSELLLDTFNSLPRKTYVYGEKDSKSFLLPRLVGASVACIPSAGHFVMLDNPIAFRDAVVRAVT